MWPTVSLNKSLPILLFCPVLQLQQWWLCCMLYGERETVDRQLNFGWSFPQRTWWVLSLSEVAHPALPPKALATLEALAPRCSARHLQTLKGCWCLPTAVICHLSRPPQVVQGAESAWQCSARESWTQARRVVFLKIFAVEWVEIEILGFTSLLSHSRAMDQGDVVFMHLLN